MQRGRDSVEYDDVVSISIQDEHEIALGEEANAEAVADEDEEFEHECGYFLVKMLRGSTLGRQIKREAFKLGVYEFLYGFILFIISVYQGQRFGRLYGIFMSNNPKIGGSLLGIQFVNSIGACIFAIITAAAMRFWASLVTNRELLASLLKLYQFLLVIHFTICLWGANALGETFEKYFASNQLMAKSPITIQNMYPSYCATMSLSALYLFLLLYNGLNVTYYTEIMEKTDGVIEEPDVDPEDVYDLSGYTLIQFLLLPLTLPIMLLITMKDYLEYAYDLAKDWVEYRLQRRAEAIRMRRSFFHRINKTLLRLWRNLVDSFSASSAPIAVAPAETTETLSELRAMNQQLDENRLRAEREQEYAREKEITRELERKKLAEEAERLRVEAEEKEKREVEAQRQREIEALQKQELDEKARQKSDAEAALAAEVEKRRLAEEREKEEVEQRRIEELRSPTLSKDRYKELWSILPPAGSFQCKLKIQANLDAFKAHLEKQGFHVVFTTSPADSDTEVGISNIRSTGEGPWFVGRFIMGKASFSAVMKCEDQSVLTGFVKKFALAKILKIDTSS